MKQLITKIIENKKIKGVFYKIRLESQYLANNARPGQFIEVRCSEEIGLLLRKPFSVHRILDDGIEILCEVVGKGTELLAKKNKNELLDVIGPLGNGFTYDAKALRPYAPILVAGGIGVAPLIALAETLVSRLSGSPVNRLKVLIGACKKEHILCEKDFKKLGAEVIITTEDGSKGHKGLVTDLLRNTQDARRTTIYACGPAAMLKAVAKIAEKMRIPCQVSMEERMACGVGVCLGCPVKVKMQNAKRSTQYEYKMVCKDGPVFNAEEISW